MRQNGPGKGVWILFASVWALGDPQDLVPQIIKKGGSLLLGWNRNSDWPGLSRSALDRNRASPRPVRRFPAAEARYRKHILTFCSIYGQWTTRPECTCLATPKSRRFGQAGHASHRISYSMSPRDRRWDIHEICQSLRGNQSERQQRRQSSSRFRLKFPTAPETI